jgi:hypothetical protein
MADTPQKIIANYTLKGSRNVDFNTDFKEGTAKIVAINSSSPAEVKTSELLHFSSVVIPRMQRYQMQEVYQGSRYNVFGERATMIQISGFIVAEERPEWVEFKEVYLYSSAYDTQIQFLDKTYKVRVLSDTLNISASDPNQNVISLNVIVL